MLPEIPADPAPLVMYEFLQVNGFIYRANLKTGQMWKLEPSASEKKTQVWKLIEELTAAAH